MKFLNLLKPTADTQTLAKVMRFNEDTNFQMFQGIKVNDNLWISIQASYGHYCSPRKTLRNLADYQSMEFALMGAERQFVSVTEVLPSFSRLEEIEESFDGSVYSYVPVDLINDLCKELKII